MKNHECCFHIFSGPIHMVVPDGHVIEKCCGCSCTRSVHREHLHEHGSFQGRQEGVAPWRSSPYKRGTPKISMLVRRGPPSVYQGV